MIDKYIIDCEVEETLISLDAESVLENTTDIYETLMAKYENRSTRKSGINSIIANTSSILLLMIIVINLLTIVSNLKEDPKPTAKEKLVNIIKDEIEMDLLKVNN